MKRIARIAAVMAAVGLLLYGAATLSPGPSAQFYRWWMDQGAWSLSRALEKHVPRGVAERLDERYDSQDPDALLDVYFPEEVAGRLPAILWLHGGGFISGDRRMLAPYMKILAARGYVVVAVGYSLAPGRQFPVQLGQINTALGYVVKNAEALRIDPSRLFLAGDSAGAQLAAQIANIVSVPSYAKALGISPSIRREQLRGVILHCGVYDLGLLRGDGPFGHIMRTIVWSYSGRKEVGEARDLPEFSVNRYVTKDFPPAFISAGNADPLLPHSRALADALAKAGARVDTLFFPDDYRPALPHEYQFNLDRGAGREALERTIRFLKSTY